MPPSPSLLKGYLVDSQFKYIPMYVEGKSRDDLIKNMIKQNLADQVSYRYFDIQFDDLKKVWVAWFYPENDRINRMAHRTNQTGRVGEV
jgi:hypothetical protein